MKKALLLVAVLLALAAPSFAQVSGTGFAIIKAWDGSNVINVGDNANTSLRVNCIVGCSSSGSGTIGAAVPSTAVMSGFSDGTNVQFARVFDLDTGGGAQYGIGVNLRRSAAGGSSELIGQNTMALSIPVVIASDQAGITVQQNTVGSANNDGAAVSVTVASGTVLASFATRRFASICSVPDNTQIVYLKLGATAGVTDYPLYIGSCWNTPGGTIYSGVIDARSASGTQSVAVMEW